MTTDDTPQVQPITIEHLMAHTGFGRVQVRRLVRQGQLPGQIDETSRRYFCAPGEFAKWLAGDWEPRPKPAPVQMLRTRKSA